MGKAKSRLDSLLLERKLAGSRERAKALIMAGSVLVDDVPVDKAGAQVPDDARIELKGSDIPYVSRGGLKLEGALEDFGLDVEGLVCLDAGASTGGFTDCLLAKGASKVFAVDVGYGQLAWKLRQDPRVVVIERTNVRHMKPGRPALPRRFGHHRRVVHFPEDRGAGGGGLSRGGRQNPGDDQAPVRGGTRQGRQGGRSQGPGAASRGDRGPDGIFRYRRVSFPRRPSFARARTQGKPGIFHFAGTIQAIRCARTGFNC